MLSLQTRLLLFILALLMSLTSVYFEWELGLTPCPLCIMQRVAAFCLTIIFFCWCCFKSGRIHQLCFYAVLFFSLAGLYFSARQVYIMAYPHSLACGPDLNTLLQYFPWQVTARALFYGSGDCGVVTWHFLTVPMPVWSLLLFVFFLFVTPIAKCQSTPH